MRLIAHRGFAAVAPENTRAAVREAAAVADAVEVDVRRCATGEPVVIHDETVDRVTDDSGPVADHALAELRALDVLGTGEGVPTLEAVLAAVPDSVGVVVDLKTAGTETAVDRLSRPGAVVSSFAPALLSACRDRDPSVPRALLTDDGGPAAVETAADLGCARLQPSLDCCDGRLVERAHAAGLTVDVWTIERRAAAESAARWGVDGVIADRPGVRPELVE